MKSVQVKLQSSRLDMHFGESLLELTSVCRPQLKPGGKLSYKAQHEMTSVTVIQFVSASHNSSWRKSVDWTEKGTKVKKKKKIHITLFILL